MIDELGQLLAWPGFVCRSTGLQVVGQTELGLAYGNWKSRARAWPDAQPQHDKNESLMSFGFAWKFVLTKKGTATTVCALLLLMKFVSL